jgi:hypothetical protein
LYRRPRTTKPEPGHKIYPYLLRSMEITRPNQVWVRIPMKSPTNTDPNSPVIPRRSRPGHRFQIARGDGGLPAY